MSWLGRSLKRVLGSVRRHKIVVFAVAVVLVGVVGVVVAMTGDPSPGTTAPGSHEWWSLGGDSEATFCGVCHNAITAELAAGPHKNAGLSTCAWCHAPTGGSHVAAPAECVDCHSAEATELGSDSHAGIMDDLGETEANASWSCKACHTHVETQMTVTLRGPLQLDMAPTP